MNTDGTQIGSAARDYSLQPVTHQLIGAAFEVHSVLGYGFLERVYQRAMQVELESRGVKVELEPKIKVQFIGVIVGDYAADLLVTDNIIVELRLIRNTCLCTKRNCSTNSAARESSWVFSSILAGKRWSISAWFLNLCFICEICG